ncbi:MAG: nucleotidyltransferase family protein [Bacteroidetes bacterium]|nr:nucleotidyltransferase family protein [Bacteroidota bacterium]
MNYKQCLFFVAKCLTLDQHPERIQEVKTEINKNTVNWENIVKLSSGQFVLPALYLQLKRNGLLPDLPEDLVEYLEEITDLNRKRNLAILEQVKEITSILHAQHISPVFLKGVAHVLAGLYVDIAERMIGDIDFLVPEDKMVEAADLLIKQGYVPLVEYKPEMFSELKHFPRLQNFKKPAAVEIHKEVLNPGYQKLFRGFEILQDKQPVVTIQNQAFIPSVSNMIIHNVFNAQINDKAYYYDDILLRQMYDLCLLSLKADIIETAKIFGKKFNIFNTYFAVIAYVFSNPKRIIYQKTLRADFYIKKINFFLSHASVHQFIRTIKYLLWRFFRYITIPILSIFQKNTRKLLYYRLRDPKWYGAHFRSYRKMG